jgi:hypothetical protein
MISMETTKILLSLTSELFILFMEHCKVAGICHKLYSKVMEYHITRLLAFQEMN